MDISATYRYFQPVKKDRFMVSILIVYHIGRGHYIHVKKSRFFLYISLIITV